MLISDPIFLEMLKLDGCNRKPRLFFSQVLWLLNIELYFSLALYEVPMLMHGSHLVSFRANKTESSDELVKQVPSSGSYGAENTELHGLGCPGMMGNVNNFNW